MKNPFSIIKRVIIYPDEFFQEAKKFNIIEAMVFYVFINIILLLIGIATLSAGVVPGNFFSIQYVFSEMKLQTLLLVPVFFFEIGILNMLLFPGFTLFFSKVFNEKIKTENLFKSFCFGSTPAVLFSWIPVINTLFGLWGWYLFIRGTSITGGLKMERVFVITIPTVILAAIVNGIVSLLVISSI